MVVGQLPFINSTKEPLNTQERRKRLVEQINKGLSTTQRRYLAPFSIEFRAMTSRLLVPDPNKRISIGELLFHPWITEKGRKVVKTNPIRKLDDKTKLLVIAILTRAN